MAAVTADARALLDTSVIIDYPAAEVRARAREAAVTTVTLAELAFGLHTPDPLVNAGREERYAWVRATFDAIPFEAPAARVYGVLAATVRSAGRDPRPRRFDLLIAAVAISQRLPLLTRNPADFRHLHDALRVIAIP